MAEMDKGKYRGKVVIRVWENCLPEVEFEPEESETFTYREVGWMKRGLEKKLGMIHKQILRDEKMAERIARESEDGEKCPVCDGPAKKVGEDFVCLNEECREFNPMATPVDEEPKEEASEGQAEVKPEEEIREPARVGDAEPPTEEEGEEVMALATENKE